MISECSSQDTGSRWGLFVTRRYFHCFHVVMIFGVGADRTRPPALASAKPARLVYPGAVSMAERSNDARLVAVVGLIGSSRPPECASRLVEHCNVRFDPMLVEQPTETQEPGIKLGNRSSDQSGWHSFPQRHSGGFERVQVKRDRGSKRSCRAGGRASLVVSSPVDWSTIPRLLLRATSTHIASL